MENKIEEKNIIYFYYSKYIQNQNNHISIIRWITYCIMLKIKKIMLTFIHERSNYLLEKMINKIHTKILNQTLICMNHLKSYNLSK